MVFCKNKESAKVYATVIEQSQTFAFPHMEQHIEGEIGAEGWEAIRRAVEYMAAAGVRDILVRSDRNTMGAGRKEDIKDIWDIASWWGVLSDDLGWVTEFDKDDGGRWEDLSSSSGIRLRAGLSQVIEMTEEEWQEYRRRKVW